MVLRRTEVPRRNNTIGSYITKQRFGSVGEERNEGGLKKKLERRQSVVV